MARTTGSNRKKGRFSVAGLKVAKAYVFPRRWRLLLAGLYATLAVGAYFAIDQLFLHGRFVSGGPLSSAHARIENDCASCHVPAKAVADGKCSNCHEKTGDDLGVFTFAAHAVFRSGDASRIYGARTAHRGERFVCADCHSEHRGRDATISSMSDRQCLGCHDYGSFNRKHPEFQFARDSLADASTMLFTHRRHTQFVMKKIQEPNVEQSCLYCHTPEPDGQHFRPLDFDVHCAECHLDGNEKTAFLAVLDPSDPGRPGVETLDMIQDRGGPGTVWASYASPTEFAQRGGKVSKKPVYHEDPWILENLRRIRRQLYPNAELVDLLETSGTGASAKQLYGEAIRTLDGYALGLRGRSEPGIATELKWIDSLLTQARLRVRATPTTARDSAFALTAGSGIAPAQRSAIDELVASLTERCAVCHVVSDASIQRVAADQRTMIRAEFDHRTHIVDRRCLDCHDAIPITDEMRGGREFVAEMDKAAIHNLPRIANCRECHRPGQVANQCVTCHFYHPNKTERGNLLLYASP